MRSRRTVFIAKSLWHAIETIANLSVETLFCPHLILVCIALNSSYAETLMFITSYFFCSSTSSNNEYFSRRGCPAQEHNHDNM